jgi:hypothetical protein
LISQSYQNLLLGIAASACALGFGTSSILYLTYFERVHDMVLELLLHA